MYRLLFLLILSSSVFASPMSTLNKVGSGEMRYLFWTVYKADYYVEANNNELVEERASIRVSDQTEALEIEYFKSIKRDVLIKATIEQWEHLGYTDNDINRWASPLIHIWPNVEPGNTLTLLVEGSSRSQFYFNNELIGTITTEAFGPAFLSIWLSENTSEPELRRELLGIAQ